MRYAACMALAGQLSQPAAVVTRVTNRVIRISHRMLGFGVASAVSSRGGDPDVHGLAQYCLPAGHDASTWAEMAAELRLRDVTRQATRP